MAYTFTCEGLSQAERPATYKAVLVWRERNLDRESPSIRAPTIPR